jgi:exopolysaccharide biosynthesis polyprenyl glycosylphosphotransferase
VLILNGVGAYSPRRTYRAVLETSNIVLAVAIAVFVFSGVWYIGYREYSRLQAFYFISLLGMLTLLHRAGLRGYFRLIGGRTYDSRSILVVGNNELADRVAQRIRAFAWTGIFLVGFIHDHNETDHPVHTDKPVIGSIDQLDAMILKEKVDDVIIALKQPNPSRLRELVLPLHEKGVRVRLAPDVQELAYLLPTVEDINGLLLIGLRDPALTPAQRMIKRIFDIVMSVLLTVIAFPLMLIIALIIRIDSPGSPLIIQERVGEGMRNFKMYKFRSMVKNADELQAQVLRIDEEGHIIHKLSNDPRVTRVGAFLRRTSLDELPQLFNVLKADMSLVGPRPELPWMVDKYEPWQKKRFEVPQGITGWWQINGRSENLMHLSTEDDIYYILNYSVWLDLIILIRTIPAVFSGRGAF